MTYPKHADARSMRYFAKRLRRSFIAFLRRTSHAPVKCNSVCAAVTQRARQKKELVKAHAAPSHKLRNAAVLVWVQDVQLFKDLWLDKILCKRATLSWSFKIYSQAKTKSLN